MSAVVVGGGPNGLVAATLLAKAGRKVTLLDRAPEVGGMAAGFEFHPGYRSTGLLPRVCVPEVLVRELGLDLPSAPRPDVLLAEAGGPGLLVPGDLAAAAARVQGADAAGLAALAKLVGSIRRLVAGLLEAPAPQVQGQPDVPALVRTAVRARRLGRAEMLELLRVAPGCVDDLLREHLKDERLIALLAADALPGTWMGPRSPGTSATWLLQAAAEGRHVSGDALVDALRKAAQAAGVTVQTGAAVTRIRMQAGRVVGVDVDGRAGLDAALVVSALDPRRTLLDLVHPTDLPPAIERDIRGYRARGAQAWVLVALGAAPSFGGHSGVTRVRVGSQVNAWERTFDALKYRILPEQPTLDIRVSPAARGAVLEVGVHGVPYTLDGGWTDAARETLADAVLAQLAAVNPAIRETVVGRAVVAPPDIEARTGSSGGHVTHGELALDQLWVTRPTLKLARHGTAIGGLFLASPGTHPGGVWTGASGRLAAKAALGA